MAQAIPCDLCQAENALVMQSNMENGTTVAVGPSCLVLFYLTVAGEILSEMPAETAAAHAPMVADLVGKLPGVSAATMAQVVSDTADENPQTGDMEVTADATAD